MNSVPSGNLVFVRCAHDNIVVSEWPGVYVCLRGGAGCARPGSARVKEQGHGKAETATLSEATTPAARTAATATGPEITPTAPRLALDAGDGLKIKPKEGDLQ